MDENKKEKIMCSLCPHREAVNKSVYNPGTYYCSECANYVAAEFGMQHLKPIDII